MKSREGRQVHSLSNAPFFSRLPRSRIMGCGQRTSEELDTLHSSPKPINLALPPQWSSCLAATVFSLLHFHFIPLTAQPLIHAGVPSLSTPPTVCMGDMGERYESFIVPSLFIAFWLPLFFSNWFHLIKSQRQLTKTTPLWNTMCEGKQRQGWCEAQSYLM